MNEDKSIFRDKMLDYDECEWCIDKTTAGESDKEVIKTLYEKELYQLSALFVDLIQKKEKEGLEKESADLYRWVEKVRKRKAEDREY